MTDDFWRELMEEQPHGDNHGRKRSPFGSWEDLAEDVHKVYEDDLFVHYEQTIEPLRHVKHGTYSAYKNDKCRCDLCRAANSRYVRAKRGISSE